MNETTHEQLSALLDGELPRDELRFLLRRMDSDAALAQRWSRYQLASAVLKRQAIAAGDDRFVAAVMTRLDAAESPAVSATRLGPRLLRWAGGGAIAATVAVAALVLTKPAIDVSSMPAGNAIVAAPPSPSASPPAPDLHPLPQQLLPAGFADYAQPASFESMVPNYAPRYSAGQVVSGVSEGFVPYVLVVGSRQMLEPQPSAKQDSAKQ